MGGQPGQGVVTVPMDDIRIIPPADYPGEGRSLGLSRGLLVYYGDLNLTGEGMGIGSVAFRDQGCTYFSRSWTDSTEQGVFKRTFTLDTRMRWSIGGISSGLLTRLIETGISAYMHFPRIQGIILSFSSHTPFPHRHSPAVRNNLLPAGNITFTYRVTGHHVDVHVGGTLTDRSHGTICLLNELSAAWFTAGWDGERPVSPPPGWEKVSLSRLPVSLVDQVHGIRFFIDEPSVSPPVPYTVFQGREYARDLCWAGFCIEIGHMNKSQSLPEVQYRIGFIRGGGVMSVPTRQGVTLVYPYFRSMDPVEKLFPPLGIAYLASQIRELGIPVTVADCTFETFDGVIDRIAASRPAIIGISIMVTMSRNAFGLLHKLRERLPETLFVAGGPLPSVNPAMFAGQFDIVFRGEGDVTFPRFCRDYLSSGCHPRDLNALDLESYPGIYVNKNGRVFSSPPVHNPSEILDLLPLPDRSGFDHRQYQETIEKNTGFKQTSLIVTRGCPFSCDFCSKPVWGDLFRKPLLEKVFREIEEIVSLGYNCLWIADDCFTLDQAYLVAFCQEMIRREVPVSWTCLSRMDQLTPDACRSHEACGMHQGLSGS